MKKITLLLLLVLMGTGMGVYAQAPEIVNGKLTVYDGIATNRSIPYYGYYADNYCRSQYIIPKEDLVNMNGKTIYGLKYYLSTSVVKDWATTVDVYLEEVSYTQFSVLAFETKSHIGYTGAILRKLSTLTGLAELTVTFDSPITYAGGNLLIGFDNTTKGTYDDSFFYGTGLAYDAAIYGYSNTALDAISTIKSQQFIPKTTFFVDASAIDQDAALALIEWIDAIVTPIELTSEDAIVAARTAYDALPTAQQALVTNLDKLEGYEVTLAALKAHAAKLVVSDLAAGDITATSATISWNGTGDSYDLRYVETPATQYSMGFEDLEDFSGWQLIDADGDGNNWEKNTSYHHTGTTCIASASYKGGALTPDNYLVSPQVTLGGKLTFWAKGSSSWPDHFGVAVSTASNTDASAFTMIGAEYDVTDSWTQYTYDLSDYSGKGYVAIRHFGCTDKLRLYIDDVEISEPFVWTTVTGLSATEYALTGLDAFTDYTVQARSYAGMEAGAWTTITFKTAPDAAAQAAIDAVIDKINAIGTVTLSSGPTIDGARSAYDALAAELQPYVTNYTTLTDAETTLATLEANALIVSDLAAGDITSTSATISWTGTGDSYDLRFAVTTHYSMGFESAEDFSGWQIIDDDGDGNNWDKTTSYYHTGDYSIRSISVSRTPDNYLVSPFVELGGTLTFWARGSGSWSDHFGVAVSTTSNTDASAFTMIGAEYDVTSTWTQYTYDLSSYSGMGYVAIRHYDCTDQNWLIIDDIEIIPNFTWAYAVGLSTTEYALTGLDAMTDYTVEVRSHYGASVGEWTKITFKTAPDATAQAKIDAVIALINAISDPVTLADEKAIGDARTAFDALAAGQQPYVTNYTTLTDAEESLATLINNALTVDDLKAKDILSTSATVTWTGTGDSYDLSYIECAAINNFDTSIDPWTTIDADGDGYCWQLKYKGDGYTTLSGSYACISSASYINDVGALTPDNWLVSPQVELGGYIEFWATGQDKSDIAEHFQVYVSTTGNTDPADFMDVSPEYVNATSRDYEYYYVDLSSYSGKGYVAIRHFNCSDQYWLNIEDVRITGPGVSPTNLTGLTDTHYAMSGLTPDALYGVYVRSHYGTLFGDWASLVLHAAANDVDAAAANAVIDLIDAIDDPVTLSSESGIEAARTAYDALTPAQQTLVTNYTTLTDAEAAFATLLEAKLSITGLAASDITATSANISWTADCESYDLAYEEGVGYDFDVDIDPWTTIDADGDGFDWTWYNSANATTRNGSSGCVASASFENGYGILYPDNWLVSPKVELGGTMTFWYTGQDLSDIAEHFQVYVSTTGNTDPADFTAVSPEYVNTTSKDYRLCVVDLSAFSGQGYVAIRHFNCSDQFRLNIEDIQILEPGARTEVSGITATEYALSGLASATLYEVFVRSHYGTHVGNWETLSFETKPSDEDLSAVQAVKDLIDAIGTVTLASGKAIEAARTAYDALSIILQNMVGSTYYTTLTDAEDTFAALKDAADWYDWFYYDDHICSSSLGVKSDAFKWGIKIPAGTLTTNIVLSKVALYEQKGKATEDITLTIYNGGSTEPDPAYQIHTETFTPEQANRFHVLTLASPIMVDPTQDVWIIFSSENSYPMSISTTATYLANTNWGYYGGSWFDIASFATQGAWKIRALFQELDDQAYKLVDLSLSTESITEGEYIIVFDDDQAHAEVSGENLIASSGVISYIGDYAYVPKGTDCNVTIAPLGTSEFSILLADGVSYIDMQKGNSITTSETPSGFTISDGGSQHVLIEKEFSSRDYALRQFGSEFRMYEYISYTLPQLYRKIIPTYTVRWEDWDGTLLDIESYPEGDKPVYKGAEPARPSTVEYDYPFLGWEPFTAEVTEDITLTAAYEAQKRNYVVTWKMDDGTVIEDQTVPYGETPTHADPIKPSTAQYNYTFTGWSPAVVPVFGNIEYTATFKAEERSYTVTWNDWDDTELTHETYKYGATPSYKGADPTRDATAQYNYTFSGWNPAIGDVAGDITYTAVYSAAERSYTVTWVNWDGAEISHETCKYGVIPAFSGSTPERPSTAEFSYAFKGWSPAVAAVSGDVTYMAAFTETKRSYTVTWKMDDGTVIDDATYLYGETPTHADPTKDPTAQYTYKFLTWNPAVGPVSEDTEYTAAFEATVRSYTVTWLNWDGSELTKETYKYGETPSYKGSTPSRPATIENTFFFTGWSPALDMVTGDATYKAQFSATGTTYTVTWKMDDGSVIASETYVYGDMPSHASPTKDATAQYTYTFDSWTPAIGTVTADATYTAVFKAEERSYTVTWKNWDGAELTKETYKYGTTPSYKGSDPTRDATAEFSYTFTGWTPALDKVTGDAAYTAVYKETKRSYTVTWKMDDGTVIADETYLYGQTPSIGDPTKTETAQYTYTFAGWTPTVVPVTGDAAYTAVFKAEERSYTVTWKNWDGAELNKETYVYGATPSYKGSEPTRDATAEFTYTFDGWSPVPDKVTGDAAYTAVFKETKNSYTVTWKMDDGTEIDKATYLYGETPTHADPTKDATVMYSYIFTGWDPAVAAVTGNATYTAVFKAVQRTYSVIFLDKEGNPIEKQEVLAGGAAVAPEAPAVEGFHFTGWDKAFDHVTEDLTVTALYAENDYKPTNLNVLLTPQEKEDVLITVSWDKVEGAASYELRMAIGENELFSQNTEGLNTIARLLSALVSEYKIDPGTYNVDWAVRSTDAMGKPISDWVAGSQFEITVKGTATGIENGQWTMDNGQWTKVLRDGHIYILVGEKMYDATGRLVK